MATAHIPALETRRLVLRGPEPQDYPNFKAVATTLREAHSASVNGWTAVVYCNGEFCKV